MIPLDPRLQQDTYILGHFAHSVLLLNKNALFPWFILVPNTDKTELHELDEALQCESLEQVNLLAQFIKEHEHVDKINTAAIGNVVSQLHIHIVGRRHDDVCWPHVVWGVQETATYDDAVIDELKRKLKASFQDSFCVAGN
ncbi:MAG: HIT family protein [Mariprofundaceae bacterium]|nr:HIT family protein [Mariprofundaceae bacterium]